MVLVHNPCSNKKMESNFQCTTGRTKMGDHTDHVTVVVQIVPRYGNVPYARLSTEVPVHSARDLHLCSATLCDFSTEERHFHFWCMKGGMLCMEESLWGHPVTTQQKPDEAAPATSLSFHSSSKKE